MPDPVFSDEYSAVNSKAVIFLTSWSLLRNEGYNCLDKKSPLNITGNTLKNIASKAHHHEFSEHQDDENLLKSSRKRRVYIKNLVNEKDRLLNSYKKLEDDGTMSSQSQKKLFPTKN